MTRLRVGDVDIWQIVESERVEIDSATLFPRASAREIAEALRRVDDRDTDGEGRLLIGVSGYLIRAAGRRILVDACAGIPGAVAGRLKAAGVHVDEVDLVVSTHVHGDRVGGNTVGVEGRFVPAFPRARFWLCRTEFEYHRSRLAEGGEGAVPRYFLEGVLPLQEADRLDLVDANAVLLEEPDTRIWLEPAFGHTAGQVAVWIESRGACAVVTADIAHHPAQIACPALSAPNEIDPAAAETVRRSLIARLADSNMILLAAHFRPLSPGRIVGSGDDCRFVRL